MTMTEVNGRPVAADEAVLLICTRCNRTGGEVERNGVRSGTLLLETVRASPIHPNICVQPIACMSGCKRACAIGLIASNKVGYVFGDLPPDASAADAIIQGAAPYAASKDSFLARAARPPLLQAGILARLPPLSWVSGGEIVWPVRSPHFQ
jgi:predicted metal-binding protein